MVYIFFLDSCQTQMVYIFYKTQMVYITYYQRKYMRFDAPQIYFLNYHKYDFQGRLPQICFQQVHFMGQKGNMNYIPTKLNVVTFSQGWTHDRLVLEVNFGPCQVQICQTSPQTIYRLYLKNKHTPRLSWLAVYLPFSSEVNEMTTSAVRNRNPCVDATR